MDGAAVVAAAMWLAPAAVSAQSPMVVNARVEISAAVAGSSATQEAIERQAASQDRVRQQQIAAQQQEIAALQTRLIDAAARGTAEVAGLELQLAEAREAFVADLARRDQAYAAEIDVIRRQVNDIASTAEGAAALSVYNSGDRLRAVAILDRLRRARDAGQARQIATLTRNALESGDPNFDTGGVIARYEEVTRLDPGVRDDWYQLFWLYLSAQQSAEAFTAAGQLEALATDDRERSEAHNLTAGILLVRGDTEGALVRYLRSIEFLERMYAANPSTRPRSLELTASLRRIVEFLLSRGNVDAASALQRRMREVDEQRGMRWIEEPLLTTTGSHRTAGDPITECLYWDARSEIACALPGPRAIPDASVSGSAATLEAIETIHLVRIRESNILWREVAALEFDACFAGDPQFDADALFYRYLTIAKRDTGNPDDWSRLAVLFGVSGRCPQRPAEY